MHTLLAVAALVPFALSALAADTKMSVKVEKEEPPRELSDAVRGVLSDQGLKVSDEKGRWFCTVWPVKSLVVKGDTGKGLRYSDIEETTVVAAIQFSNEWKDYRKQKVKPGVYTLRMAVQPMDGDHMGTAPYNDFLLLSPAAADTKPELLDLETMYKLSTKSTARKHPSMMLLFPNKEAAEVPRIEAKPKEHYVLSFRMPITASGQKAFLGFSLVIIGETSAE